MATLGGCITEQVTAPTTVQLVVHAVLDPSSRVQLVWVEEANTGQPRTAANGRCRRDAQVTITTPDHLAMRADDQADSPAACGPFRVPLDRYGVTLAPGGTYALRVVTADGHEVTGTTTLPLAEPVNSPGAAEVFSRRRDTLHVEFTPVAGAATHELRIVTQYNGYRHFVDGPATLPGTMTDLGGSDIFPGGTQSVTLAAVDVNYYEYYRATSDPLSEGLFRSRLSGGVGVFGSIVVIQRRVLLVKP